MFRYHLQPTAFKPRPSQSSQSGGCILVLQSSRRKTLEVGTLFAAGLLGQPGSLGSLTIAR